MKLEELSRRQVRYWLFRFRTEKEGGAKATGAPRGLRKRFEGQPEFDGWAKFGMTWDVAEGDYFKAVPRKYTIHEEWNATLRRLVIDLPRIPRRNREVKGE